MRIVVLVLIPSLVACGDDGGKAHDAPPAQIDAVTVDARTEFPDAPASCADKLAFTQATGCGNDGSVEFCIPENMNIEAQLAAISSTISCAPGGGRANCNATPGLLLCFYPTAFPGQCETDHGAMTDETFTDMCAIAAIPQITQIVPTLFE